MGLVLIAMTVRVVVGLIIKCVFIVGGEVAVAIWALAGWGGDLDMVPIWMIFSIILKTAKWGIAHVHGLARSMALLIEASYAR